MPAEDIGFVAERYFPDIGVALRPLRSSELYAQRAEIARLFGFGLWSEGDRPALVEAATELARRDVTPSFLGLQLLAVLRDRKIVRPGYTTLQSVISTSLTAERKRLDHLVEAALDAQTVKALRDLLVRTETLPELAALAEIKKDASNFRYKIMTVERQKRATLAPLYQAAKALLPTLGISQQNIQRYADLALSYTIYDLRRMRPAQAHLYLLCYAWQRFRQLSDNLVDAFDHHLSKIEDETKAKSLEAFTQAQAKRQQEAPSVGRVLLLYVDEAVDDATPFGSVRKQAFATCHESRCSALASGCAMSPSASWSCAGTRSTGPQRASRRTCVRSSWPWTSRPSRQPVPGWRHCPGCARSSPVSSRWASGRSPRSRSARSPTSCVAISTRSTKLVLRSVCAATATSSGSTGSSPSVLRPANSRSMTVCVTAASAMSSCRWRRRLPSCRPSRSPG